MIAAERRSDGASSQLPLARVHTRKARIGSGVEDRKSKLERYFREEAIGNGARARGPVILGYLAVWAGRDVAAVGLSSIQSEAVADVGEDWLGNAGDANLFALVAADWRPCRAVNRLEFFFVFEEGNLLFCACGICVCI